MRYITKNGLSFILFLSLFFTMFINYTAVYADTPDTVYMRAKIVYEYEDETVELTDENVYVTEGWEKDEDDGWYYYDTEVYSGETIRFIEWVQIPTEWENETEDKEFAIVIYVQVADAVSGDSGWDENTNIIYEETWYAFSTRYEPEESVYVQKESISVEINEYEYDEDGNLVEYENDKLITPGQLIYKIVEFTVKGEVGALIDIVLEDPIKHVYQNGVDVDGKVVEGGSVVMYVIEVKNTAPDTRDITITDVVDERLLITEIGNDGELIEATSSGYGGTIQWVISVEAGETDTVFFMAQVPEVDGEYVVSIPNTATMELAGQYAQTNTVVVSVGADNVLQKLQNFFTRFCGGLGTSYQIARKTGDYTNLMPYIIALILGITVLFIVIRKVIKNRRATY